MFQTGHGIRIQIYALLWVECQRVNLRRFSDISVYDSITYNVSIIRVRRSICIDLLRMHNILRNQIYY